MPDASLVVAHSRRLFSTPWVLVLLLAAAAVLIYHRWLTSTPAPSGDWPYWSDTYLRPFFPWPHIVDASVGHGFADFTQFNTAPMQALGGMLATVGVTRGIAEKLLFFAPFAILSAVGPWMLAREILGSTRWALVSALLYAGNSSVIIHATGQLYIGVAQGVASLVLFAHLRAARDVSLRWAIVTGLLLSGEAWFDLRITYLTGACLLVGTLVYTAHPIAIHRRRLRLLGLFTATLAVSAAAQLYWILPFVTYHGTPYLGLPPGLFASFITFGHAITASDPTWTGADPATFHTLPLDPILFAVPVLAFALLAMRNVRSDYLWLCLLALMGAFLLKSYRPPAGQVYVWMFEHLPGWHAFRDTSKIFWVVALAYSVLGVAALRGLVTWLIGRQQRVRSLLVWTPVCIIAATVVIGPPAENLEAVWSGAVGRTFSPVGVPTSFQRLQHMIDGDRGVSAVGWMGGQELLDSPQGQIDGHDHVYLLASENHPLITLSGGPSTNPLDGGSFDPLSRFCPVGYVPYCYVKPSLFAYLLRELGVGYLVLPVGSRVGRLPSGLTGHQVLDRVMRAIGPATQFIGRGAEQLALWRIADVAPLVSTTDLVVRVWGPTESLQAVLPAVERLGTPAVFDDTRNRESLPPDDSVVDVMPVTSVGVVVPRTAEYMIGHGIDSTNAGALAGPVQLTRGPHTLEDLGDRTAQFLVSWSVAAEAAWSGSSFVRPVRYRRPSSETIYISGSMRRWVIVRTTWDSAWSLDGSSAHLVADGDFNLYRIRPATTAALTAQFTTALSESVGLGVTLLAIATSLFLALRPRRRRMPRPALSVTGPAPGTAQTFAVVGCIALIVAAMLSKLSSLGLPSVLPGWFASFPTAPGGTPYASAVAYYVALAVMLQLLSCAIRLVPSTTRLASVARRMRRFAAGQRFALWTAAIDLCLLLALTAVSCGQTNGPSSSLNGLVRQAQAATSSGDLPACISAYTKVLAQDPQSIVALSGRATCELMGGDAEAATLDLDQAVSLSGADPNLYIARARAYSALGNYSKATSDYTHVLKLSALTSGECRDVIDGLVGINFAADAIRSGERCLELFPSSWTVWASAGTAEAQGGKTSDALIDLQRAIDLSSGADRAFALAQRASLYKSIDDLKHAAADLLSAEDLDPSTYGYHEERGTVLLAIYDLVGAEQEYTAALRIINSAVPPDTRAEARLLFERGHVYRLDGQAKAAVMDLTAALAVWPESDPAGRTAVSNELAAAK